MSDPTYRSLVAGEFHLFNRYVPTSTSGVGARSRTFDEYVAAGHYRHDWVWVAQRSDEVLARVAFWAPPEYAQPFSVDFFDPGTDLDVGAELLRAAYAALVTEPYDMPTGNDRPDYHLFLPADWRDHPDAMADANDRITAAEKAGLRFFVERVNLRWTPERGLPARSTRLRFGPATDDELVVDVLMRLCENSLDSYAARDVERYGPRRAAEVTIEETLEMGGRDWWRLAYDGDGSVVGITLPVRATDFATHAYVGVVPEHRGHHYSEDLVVETLHIFTEAGESLVHDATDVANAPMAAAFERVGYEITGRRVVML